MAFVYKICTVVLLAAFAVSKAYSDCSSAIAKVEEVYPSADQLPENLLRFYIYFSEPTAHEDILSLISLLDDQGTVVPGVFLDNRYELWSPDGRRLTLLFDPGRVKTGLVAHNHLGRALISGENYSLRIGAFENEKGCQVFTKRFQIQPAYSTRLDVADWELSQPASDTIEPLHIGFGRVMDHLSLAYRIRVEDEEGIRIRGSLDLLEKEGVWAFTPSKPWIKGRYRIAVDTALEDVAGNRLTGVFDRPSTQGELTAPPDKTYLFFSL